MRAWLALIAVRVALCFLSFDRLHGALGRGAVRNRHSRLEQDTARKRVKWALHWASRFTVGKVTCLPLALTGLYLLRHEGCPADLRIGVQRARGGSLKAHAWVECGQEVVIGGLEDFMDFHQLPRIPAREARRTGRSLPGCPPGRDLSH